MIFGKSKEDIFIICLRNVNVEELDNVYIIDELKNNFTDNDVNITTIEKIIDKNVPSKLIKTFIQKDKLEISQYLSNTRKLTSCFYCRRKILTEPIGIPIEYEKINDKDCFHCDGYVCSFNCLVSFIDEYYDEIYKKTEYLIPKLYYSIFNQYPKERIKPAPSWRMRNEYGGELTDEEYSRLFQVVEIRDAKQIYVDVFRIFNQTK